GGYCKKDDDCDEKTDTRIRNGGSTRHSYFKTEPRGPQDNTKCQPRQWHAPSVLGPPLEFRRHAFHFCSLDHRVLASIRKGKSELLIKALMLCRRSKRRWRRLDLFVSSECFRVALPNRDRKGDPEDFACPLRCSPLDLSVQCLNSYDITYAKSPRQYPVTAPTSRVFLLVLITGQSPWPGLLDLLVRGRHFDDRGALESFHKSWPARLGSHHPDCEHLFSVQGRRTARLVGILMFIPLVNFVIW